MSGPALFVNEASLADVEALTALERLCYTHPWGSGHFRAELERKQPGAVLVLRAPFASGDPARGIRAYCVFQLVLDELHVLNLAVAPEYRRQGYGRWLLQLALDVGAGRGARRALLEVRRSNEEALALYRTLGFDVVSIRRNYYESPREDAIVLEKPRLEQAVGAGGGEP